MCGSQKKKFLGFQSHISWVDHQKRCFEVAESIYHVWIGKEEVLKVRNLYIMSGSPVKNFLSCGVYIS